MKTINDHKQSIAPLILKESYPALGFALFFSLFINLLMLTVPLYMLQIFDRVLTSQSIDTLIYLTIIAIFALIVMSLLDLSRGRMLLHVGQWFDQRLGLESLSRSVDNKLRGGNYSQQCLADVNIIRQFCGSSSVFAFFDAPWVIIYLLIIYFLSVPLGAIATVGAIILALLAYINEALSRKPNQQANMLYADNSNMVGAMLQSCETIRAMGMQPALLDKWFSGNAHFLNVQKNVAQRSSIIIALAKLIRLTLQILIIGVGAFYVIKSQLSPGGMIAASIIMARGLAPIEQGMGAWKAMLDSWAAYQRLVSYLQTPQATTESYIDKPRGSIQVDDVSFTVDGRREPILQNIKFNLPQGQQLAIVGPMAAGKSTLARILVGILKPSFGTVRLDAVDIYRFDDQSRNHYLGYLSQIDSLLPGSIADNINRLSQGPSALINEAAQFVNMHQVIERLPNAYATDVAGYNLSIGQRQRIGLARAFYARPCVVVLDEPEANLDADGLVSLCNTLKNARDQGITVIYVTQHPQVARCADLALVLKQGRIHDFGETSKVIEQWLR